MDRGFTSTKVRPAALSSRKSPSWVGRQRRRNKVRKLLGLIGALQRTVPVCWSLSVAQPRPGSALDPIWLVPLPAGEPRRLPDVEVANADGFPDGRVVFSKFAQGKDGKGTNNGMDWFVTDRDGSNPHKLLSLPGNVGWVAASAFGKRILIVQRAPG